MVWLIIVGGILLIWFPIGIILLIYAYCTAPLSDEE